MPTAAAINFSADMVVPFRSPELAGVDNVQLVASTTYPKGTILGELSGVQEIQTITITGTPTGGSFTITFSGQTTAAIAFNATAAAVRQALELLSNIGVGGVLTSGGPFPGTAVVVTFVNRANVAQMTTTDSLTGGTTPASAVATTVAGSAGTPGTYKKYDRDNSDGSEIPTHILQYACVTDSNGSITVGDTAGGEWGQTLLKSISAYRSGVFATADLVGLDENAITLLKGRLVEGTLSNGIFVF